MSVPFDPQQGLIIVRAELWGPNGSGVLRLALDTGATGTVVNVGLLVALGYDPALAPDRVQVTTGSGNNQALLPEENEINTERRMPVTKEPHRSSGASCATVAPIDAVRCAHRHSKLRAFIRRVRIAHAQTPVKGTVEAKQNGARCAPYNDLK